MSTGTPDMVPAANAFQAPGLLGMMLDAVRCSMGMIAEEYEIIQYGRGMSTASAGIQL
jgi:hypothetical protein